MSTILSGIRNIIMRRGTSVTHTVSLTVQSKADITQTTFTDPDVYSKQPAKRQVAFMDTTLYASTCGLDAAGAVSAELAGGFHSGGSGIDTYERLTATIKDVHGNKMYFYRKSDKTFWERIHIPKRTTANAHIWSITKDYVRITQQQFNSKQAPKC